MPKVCIKCNVKKKLKEFPPSSFKYYRYVCKDCENAIARERREKKARVCPVCMKPFLVHGPQKACSLRCRIKFNAPENENGCWIWNLQFTDVYPCVVVNRKKELVHRLSFELFIGKVEDNDIVFQKCGNLMCVNPEHLKKISFSDFHKEKMKENQIGEDNYFAKLEEKDVSEIRKLRKDGYLLKEIAKMYEISEGHAGSICRGIWWKHSYKEKR